MQILKPMPPKAYTFTLNLTCGLTNGSSAVLGCGTEVSITSLEDIYKKETLLPNGVQHTFHWYCPCCHTENFIAVADLPTLNVQSRKTYFKNLRLKTLIELAKSRPIADRAAYITELGNEFLLDQTILDMITETEDTWSS